MATIGIHNGKVLYDNANRLGIFDNSIFLGSGSTPEGIWTIEDSVAKANVTTTLLSMSSTVSFLPVVSTTYRMEFQVTSYSGGAVRPVFGSTIFGASVESTGVYQYDIVASTGHATSKTHGLNGLSFSGKVDNFKIYDPDDTTFVYSYTYSGSNIDAYAVLFHLDYKYKRIGNLVLSNEDQNILVQQKTDRVY